MVEVPCDALFNTYCFVLFFLPAAFVGYWAFAHRTWKLSWLTLASLVFYGLWDVRFVLLLVASAFVSFIAGLRVHQSERPGRWVAAAVVYHLGVLAFFKYAMFAGDGARSLFSLLHLPVEVPYYNIVLPVGISFYTFQSLSYVIDVRRGHATPTRDLLEFVAFVSLFPQLVAGPIVRYRELSGQLQALPRRLSPNLAAYGCTLFAVGLFKKVILADPIGAHIDPLWAGTDALTTVSAWIAALGYTLQIYFDFSGYSDMALGIGALLGLRLPVNFLRPYQALNPSEFWARWHMTLSRFLRDYLYVPLGGGRSGPWVTARNVVVVMFLGGLWHGAAWTFVAWGLYHGALLVGYHLNAARWGALPKALQRVLLLLLVVIGWVVFRAPTFGDAASVYRAMFGFAALGANIPIVLFVLVLLLVATQVARAAAGWDQTGPAPTPSPVGLTLAATLLVVAILGMTTEADPFLYYRF